MIAGVICRTGEGVVSTCQTTRQHQQQTKNFTQLVDIEVVHLTQLAAHFTIYYLRCLLDTSATHVEIHALHIQQHSAGDVTVRLQCSFFLYYI